MKRAAAALICVLAACAGPRQAAAPTAARPDYPGYGSAVGTQDIPWSAASLARDFTALTFDTEWGGRAPALRRWDGPVRVALAAPRFAAYRPFLARSLDRIRAQAPRVRASLSPDAVGDIVIRAAPRAEMRAVAPGVRCFIAPFAGEWRAYRAALARGGAAWPRGMPPGLTIFIPTDAAPYEIRACMAEEVTQALGPMNDLGAFGDSIFNDDNAHIRPTAFDMLMLRTLYAPELADGMGREAARAAARRALIRFGYGAGRMRVRSGGRGYDDAMRAARTGPLAARAASARRAAAIAAARFDDHRRGEALRAMALIAQRRGDEKAAARHLAAAEAALAAQSAPASPHLARARADLALARLRQGAAAEAAALLNTAIPVLAANAADRALADALRTQAGALAALGRDAEAQGAAMEARAWARYVYGPQGAPTR